MFRKQQILIAGMMALLGASAAPAGIVINEFMTRNRGAHTNAAGDDRADWIELHNNGGLPVDLTGWHLTDDRFNLTNWAFPAFSIPSGGYLLIYADNSATSLIAGELHAGFALGTDGEYLALVAPDGATVIDEFNAYEYDPGEFGYPPQTENFSYGLNATNGLSFFNPSTPGAINAGGVADFVDDTKFSHDRGFYTNGFDLVITSATANALIYYTLNGDDPTTNSTLYTAPIRVTQTLCVRARAFKTGLYPTDIDTHTYLFLDDVIQQRQTPPPGPEWPANDINGQVIDYAMDPNVLGDPRYSELIDDALLAIPTISLVTPLDNLWDPAIGIYVNANREGDLWERVTSVEYLKPDGSKGFQENAGLRIRGGWSRHDGNPKHAFRLRFRRAYGASRLKYKMFGEEGADSFNGIDLRCAATPSWSANNPPLCTYLRDIFSRDIQLACGHPSTRGDHFHLYLNGVYWGLYQTQEKVENEYAESYMGGDKDDYDIISKKKHGYSLDGTINAYSNLWSITMDGYASPSNYFRAQGLAEDGVTPVPEYPRYLDLENLMDYMLITYYTGEKDGPASVWAVVNNYYAVINRENPDGFKHFEYDSEWSLGIGLENVVGPIAKSQWTQLNHFNGHFLHEQLVANTEYLVSFGDQVHKRMFNDGLLTTDNAIALLMKRAAEIDTAIIAESARWGDAMTPGVPSTKDDDWLPAVAFATNWMGNRTATVLNQLRNVGWYPALDAPVFNQHGGTVADGFQLSMTAPGAIYYTLDGTDPRQILTGAARGTVYTGPVPLPHSVIVKARATTGANSWSALNEALFVAEGSNTLRISEVMYNPGKPSGTETNNGATRSDFEFIEIQNTGVREIGLAGIRLTKGVTFDFTGSEVLSVPPMGHVVVVANRAAFAQRYDTNTMRIAGTFSGNLDNGGEKLELVSSRGEILAEFSYGDGLDWPLIADGAGHALIPLLFESQTNSAMDYGDNWRAGTYRHGSPGVPDPDPFPGLVINEFAAHTDLSDTNYPDHDSDDWIELFNPLSTYIDLTDYYLSDEADDLKKWRIPEDDLDPLDWISFSETRHFHNPITNGFGLNKSGEQIFLSHLPGTPDDRVVDALRFKAQENGRTLGRHRDGSPWWYTMPPTRNAANRLDGPPEIVIREVMYAPWELSPEFPHALEYIELYNPGPAPVDLWNADGVWRMNGDVEFDFPSNTTLAARDSLIVVSFHPTNILFEFQFSMIYGLAPGEIALRGPFTGGLADEGGRITLEKPQTSDLPLGDVDWVVVDKVVYSGKEPWPQNAVVTGSGIHRILDGISGEDPKNWATMPATPGSSFPPVKIHQIFEGPTMTIFSTGASGLVYQVETTTDLLAQPQSWTPVPGSSSTFVGGTNVITFTEPAPSEPRRVYRVRQTRP